MPKRPKIERRTVLADWRASRILVAVRERSSVKTRRRGGGRGVGILAPTKQVLFWWGGVGGSDSEREKGELSLGKERVERSAVRVTVRGEYSRPGGRWDEVDGALRRQCLCYFCPAGGVGMFESSYGVDRFRTGLVGP